MWYNGMERSKRRGCGVKRWLAVLLCLWLLMGAAQAQLSLRMEDTAALVDMDGVEIVPSGIYQDIVALGDGLFAAQQDGLWALMDGSGGLLTDVRYSRLHREGGMLLAELEGSWGLLNADGTALCSFEYSLIVPNGNGGCWALMSDPDDMDSDRLYRIDAQGRRHATQLCVRDVGAQVSEGMLRVIPRGGSRYGYADAMGRMCIEAVYDYAGDFIKGVAPVVLDGRYGAIDRSGGMVVPAEYDFLEIGAGGLIVAARWQTGAWVFDADGRELACYDGEDIYIAAVGEGYAVIDADFMYLYDGSCTLQLEAPPSAVATEGVNGQMIISDGMWGEACVQLSGTQQRYQNLYPLGTACGEAIYACMEADVGRYVNDRLGEVQLSTNMDSARYGVVNAAGEALIPCRYLSLEYLADDRLLARTERSWLLIDAAGSVLWEHAAGEGEAASR